MRKVDFSRQITQRQNDFLVYDDMGPFNITEGSEEYSEVSSYLLSHPEALIPEPVPPPPTEAELAAREVAAARAYLASTDWIVAKIGETQMQGKSITTLLTKYKAELGKRAAARVMINQAEA